MRPDISRTIFWDTDYDSIDWKKRPQYVIERVLSHGHLKDWTAILNYYGEEKIKEVSIQARFLDAKSLSFLSTYFNLPLESFRCYKLKQSQTALFPS